MSASGLAASQNTVWIADAVLEAKGLRSGETIWWYSPDEGWVCDVIAVGQSVFALVDYVDASYVVRLDPATGEPSKLLQVRGGIESLAAEGGNIVLSDFASEELQLILW